MCGLVVVFALATVLGEFLPGLRACALQRRPLMQTGVSSLGPGSINWLAATAFAGAFAICFILV
jgi:hypothetical protein